MTVAECKANILPEKLEHANKASLVAVKNVLYATDLSATSDLAMPYAAAICRHFGSTLHVAHVVSDTKLLLMTGGVDYIAMEALYEDATTIAQDKLKQAVTPLGEIPLRTYVREGEVWPNLAGIIAENAIDLVVVGTHGRTGIGKLLLGSVAEDILRQAPCPVLTVGPKICGRARLPECDGRDLRFIELRPRQILYATNFTPASHAAAEVALALATEFNSRLTLLHVLEDYVNPKAEPTPIEDAIRRLQAIAPKDAALAYAPEDLVEFGVPWKCIVNKAAELAADLVVLGALPIDGTTHLPWSTVHRVVAHASCPVLTVPVEARKF